MTETQEKKTRVWLVEDNSLFRTSVERGVNSLAGMACSGTFASAEKALAALDGEDPPDVILLDVQLPGMDGISALGSFRESAPNARVVILTVFDDADKIFRAVCAGAMGYVLKTSGIDRIGEVINRNVCRQETGCRVGVKPAVKHVQMVVGDVARRADVTGSAELGLAEDSTDDQVIRVRDVDGADRRVPADVDDIVEDRHVLRAARGLDRAE